MILVLNDTFRWDINVSDPTTGGKSAATGTPTYAVFEDATDTAILTGSLTQRSGYTDQYRGSVVCSAANGFEAGKYYCVRSEAVCGGVTSVTLHQFNLDYDTLTLTSQAVTNMNTFFDNGNAASSVLVSQIVTGGAPSAATVASAVWDKALSSHTTAGTAGKGLGDCVTGIPVANTFADALLDRANAIETGLTPRQLYRLLAALTLGKSSGATTATLSFRQAVVDGKVRVTVTQDGSGNWTGVTLDAT